MRKRVSSITNASIMSRTITITIFAAVAGLLIFTPNVAQAQLKKPVKLYKGKITDAKTGEPVDGGRVYIYQGDQKTPLTNSKINPQSGFYQILLDASTRYRFEIIAPSYYTTEYVIITVPGSEYEEIEQGFQAPALPMDSTLFTGNMYAAGAATIAESPQLRSALNFMKAQPTVIVSIIIGASGGSNADREARIQALKDLFRDEEISLTRIKWGKPAADKPMEHGTFMISGIEAEEDY